MSKSIKFTKMQGIGNDYVFVDCFKNNIEDPPAVAIKISDRHFGVGSDGLILIEPPTSPEADVRMRVFNADGSEAEMCGNGIRCVAKYAYDHRLARKRTLTIETPAGLKSIKLEIAGRKAVGATVDMGIPRLHRRDIPMTGEPDAEAINQQLQVGNEKYEITCVSMGNPHCVIFIESDVNNFPLEQTGPLIERHELFPQRMNVHIVQRISQDEVRMRTWERGSGITLGCGTGASAVCVAGAVTGRTSRTVLAHLPGGDLRLNWREDGHVEMTGPAVEAFSGNWVP